MTATTGRTYVKRRGYTHLPNATVGDERLSWAAVGLLAGLLMRPDRASLGYRDLVGRGLGETAVRNALRELNAAGYRHQIKVHVPRTPGARPTFRTDTVVSEEPMTTEEAAEWLADVAARKAVDNSITVPPNPPHGATSTNTPSAQVAPGRGLPEPGAPEPGDPRHVVRTTQALVARRPSGRLPLGQPPSPCTCGDASVRGTHHRMTGPCVALRPDPDDQAMCDHGEVRGPARCALCRNGVIVSP